MRVEVHVKLILVTIYPFIFRERAREILCKSYISLAQSIFLLLSHMGQYMGQYSPKYWEFQTKSQTHCLFPIHTISLYKCLSSFLYTVHTHTRLQAHTHTRTLNHTVDTEIQTCTLFHLPIQTDHTHSCMWTYCNLFTQMYTVLFILFLRMFKW